MTPLPLFSIIVPCYNQEKFLVECLTSVLQQTFENWECIIVNDGSTDNSEMVATTFQSKDPRFIVLSKQNEGLAAARNTGILASAGTYILPLDGDDKIGSNYLQEAYNVFEKNPKTKLVYCKASFFGLKNNRWDLPKYKYENMFILNCIFCSAIYKKTDYLATKGYDPKMIYGYEDWEFWLQLLSKNDIVVQLESTSFFYRQKADSMIDFVQNEQKLTAMTDYILQKHEAKFFDILGVENNHQGIVKLINNNKKLSEIKSSIAYKTIYKIERAIRKIFKKK